MAFICVLLSPTVVAIKAMAVEMSIYILTDNHIWTALAYAYRTQSRLHTQSCSLLTLEKKKQKKTVRNKNQNALKKKKKNYQRDMKIFIKSIISNVRPIFFACTVYTLLEHCINK